MLRIGDIKRTLLNLCGRKTVSGVSINSLTSVPNLQRGALRGSQGLCSGGPAETQVGGAGGAGEAARTSELVENTRGGSAFRISRRPAPFQSLPLSPLTFSRPKLQRATRGRSAGQAGVLTSTTNTPEDTLLHAEDNIFIKTAFQSSKLEIPV